jgi:hypothetical protein
MAAADAALRARCAAALAALSAPETASNDAALTEALCNVSRLCAESGAAAQHLARAGAVLALSELLPEAPPVAREPRPYPQPPGGTALVPDDRGFDDAPRYAIGALTKLIKALAPERGRGGWPAEAQVAVGMLISGTGLERLLRLVHARDADSTLSDPALQMLTDVVGVCGAAFPLLEQALFGDESQNGPPPLLVDLTCLLCTDSFTCAGAVRCLTACVAAWPHLAAPLCCPEHPRAVLGGAALPLLLAQALYSAERDGCNDARTSARLAVVALISASEEHAGRRVAAAAPDAAQLLFTDSSTPSSSAGWGQLLAALARSASCRARIAAGQPEMLQHAIMFASLTLNR